MGHVSEVLQRLLGNLGRSGVLVFVLLPALRRLGRWFEAELLEQVGDLVLLKVGDAEALPPGGGAGQGAKD